MQKKLKHAIITILAIFAVLVITNTRVDATTVTVSPSKTIYSINGSKTMCIDM